MRYHPKIKAMTGKK